MMLLVATLFCALFGATLCCNDGSDCSLNGLCLDGACTCDAPWKGSACDILDVLPTIQNNGYNFSKTSSWGGSIAQNDDDGSWHMFVAEFANHCGLFSWRTNSQVVHAVANNPLGPYMRKAVVVNAFAHNPMIRRANDGTWLLYYIGTGDGTDMHGDPLTLRDDCKDGLTPAGEGPTGGNPQRTFVRTSASVNGPWTAGTEVQMAFAPTRRNYTTNPAPFFAEDGTVWFPYRNVEKNWNPPTIIDGKERIGMAKGTDYAGPFHDLSPDGPIVNVPFEDETLWIDRRGNFHMIVHQIGQLQAPEQDGSLGHAFSPNGVDSWKLSANSPLAYEYPAVGNTTVRVKHAARPFVHVVEGIPQYISLGGKAYQPGDHTTTVVLPLRTFGSSLLLV